MITIYDKIFRWNERTDKLYNILKNYLYLLNMCDTKYAKHMQKQHNESV